MKVALYVSFVISLLCVNSSFAAKAESIDLGGNKELGGQVGWLLKSYIANNPHVIDDPGFIKSFSGFLSCGVATEKYSNEFSINSYSQLMQAALESWLAIKEDKPLTINSLVSVGSYNMKYGYFLLGDFKDGLMFTINANGKYYPGNRPCFNYDTVWPDEFHIQFDNAEDFSYIPMSPEDAQKSLSRKGFSRNRQVRAEIYFSIISTSISAVPENHDRYMIQQLSVSSVKAHIERVELKYYRSSGVFASIDAQQAAKFEKSIDSENKKTYARIGSRKWIELAQQSLVRSSKRKYVLDFVHGESVKNLGGSKYLIDIEPPSIDLSLHPEIPPEYLYRTYGLNERGSGSAKISIVNSPDSPFSFNKKLDYKSEYPTAKLFIKGAFPVVVPLKNKGKNQLLVYITDYVIKYELYTGKSTIEREFVVHYSDVPPNADPD